MGTWETLAFPTVEVDHLLSGHPQNSTAAQTVSLELPAVRGNMNCSAVLPLSISTEKETMWPNFGNVTNPGIEGLPATLEPELLSNGLFYHCSCTFRLLSRDSRARPYSGIKNLLLCFKDHG